MPLVPGIAGRKVPLGFPPDGRRLAFGTICPGVGRSLWVVDLRSGETRLVAEQPGLYWSRTGSPMDGRLGYLAPGKTGRSFWSIDVDTGETQEHRPIDADISGALPSPDGRSLVSHGARNQAERVGDGTRGRPGACSRTTRRGSGGRSGRPTTRIGVEIMRRADSRVGRMLAKGGPVHRSSRHQGRTGRIRFRPTGAV